MANTRELKNHMDGVRETQKITNAMYLIASARMKNARKELEMTRPYFSALKAEIKRIFRTVDDVESIYFYPENPVYDENDRTTYGALVITADKGLAGAYNHNVIEKTMELLSKHSDTRLFVIGEYGRHYFKEHGIKIEEDFIHTARNPNLQRARDISGILLEEFSKGALSNIFVIYTDLEKGMVANAVSTRLLPFHRSYFTEPNKTEKPVTSAFELFPSANAVLDVIIQSYISGFIYSALVDSFCSEQNARMMAMNSAGRNADKILSALTNEYNTVRQASITEEITEVSSGAKALKSEKD